MSTEIAWTDETWNITVGCSRVSDGCTNCYAERFAHRGLRPEHRGLTVAGPKGPRWTGEVRCLPERLETPLRWRKPRRVFVDSMSDLFHEKVPDEFIDRVFAVMALCPQHTFQVLTKRPERMLEFLSYKNADRRIGAAVLQWHRSQGPEYRLSNSLPHHPLRVAESLRVRGKPTAYRWPLQSVWLCTSCED